MKKLLSLILTIFLSFGIFSFSSLAQENVDAEIDVDTELTYAMDALRMLNIISDYYDYNTNYQKGVSRADFVDVVAKIIDTFSYETKEIYYYDVPENHYAYKSISMLTEMGIINGVGDNLFKPDDYIENKQVYKILLSLMGYNSVAEADGGYPDGYLKIARRIGIYQNSNDTEYLTYKDMFMILYKALDINIMMPVRYQDGYVGIETSENETLLSLYRGVYKEEGILNGAKITSLNDTNLSDENEVVIGNTIYKAEMNLTEYLGEELEYYVKKSLKNDEGTIIWAKPTGRSKIEQMKTEDVVDFDSQNYVFSYYDKNGKLKKVNLDKSTSIVFNGVEIGNEIKEAFIAPNGEIKIVKNNGITTAAIIKAYENYIVSGINAVTGTIYDKRGTGYSLVIDKNKLDFFSLKNTVGTELNLDDIVQDTVISVYRSRDGKYLEAIAHSEKISGVLQRISEKYNGTYLTVDDKEYLLKWKDDNDTLKVRSAVELYIDFAGIAAYVEKRNDTSFAAILKNCVIIEDVFESRCGLRIFTEEGQHEELFCAEKITVDGKLEKNVQNIVEALSTNGQVKPQLVLIKTNADNEVTMIDTQKINEPYENVKSSLSLNSPKGNTWKRGSGSVNQTTVVNSDTIFFAIPSVIDEDTPEKAYGVSKSLENESTFQIETYKTSDRVGYEEYVIVYDKISTGYSDDNMPVVVENVGEAMDADGNIAECIYGYQGKNYVTLMSDGDISFSELGIKKGMVVRVANDAAGLITDAEILFDINQKEEYMTKADSFRYAAGFSYSVGYLYDVVNNVVSISWSDITKVDHRVAPHTAAVIVYDTSIDKNNISVGNLNDGITAYDAGKDCSIVVAIEQSAHAKLFVLFN